MSLQLKYWVFTEDQVKDAIREFAAETATEQGWVNQQAEDYCIEIITSFLNSAVVKRRGMIKGEEHEDLC